MSKISRLFEMLDMLRARRRPVTALELAEELGVSERSVYRDVETLRLLGAPLDGQAGVGFVLRRGSSCQISPSRRKNWTPLFSG